MPKQVIQLSRRGKKKEKQHVHPQMIEKEIREAVADLEGREGMAFTTRQTCGAPREQSHVALTQQSWFWEAMTITDVLKLGSRSLVSRASCLCQKGSCQKQRANSPNPRKNEAKKLQYGRKRQGSVEITMRRNRMNPVINRTRRKILKMKYIKKSTSTVLGQSQWAKSKVD